MNMVTQAKKGEARMPKPTCKMPGCKRKGKYLKRAAAHEEVYRKGSVSLYVESAAEMKVIV